jgi:hypothetical protein
VVVVGFEVVVTLVVVEVVGVIHTVEVMVVVTLPPDSLSKVLEYTLG